ncbi:MAG: hypothetical protein ACI8PZ_003833 [Myxococcota bacterium]|jgi:hypothetical protein
MAFAHTNSRGVTYYLHARKRKGKPVYVFAREVEPGAVDALPAGYEVRESVNGQVSAGRAKSRTITAAEEEVLRKATPGHCRVEVKGRELVVHEPAGGGGGGLAGMDPMAHHGLLQQLGMKVSYEPVMRFVLVDEDDRTFEVKRRVYRGSGGWSYPLAHGPISEVAQLARHIGKQSYFNLM